MCKKWSIFVCGLLLVSLLGKAQSATVLVGDASNRVLQYKVEGPTWTYERVFAEGNYDGVPLKVPMGICQDRGGRIYIGEQADGGRVLRFTTQGSYIDTVAQDGKGVFVARCEAVVMGPDGRHVYVVDAFRGTGDQVYKIDIDTKDVSIFVPTKYDGVNLFNNPRGMSFGPNGNCFVSGRQNQAVFEFNGTTGVFVRIFTNAASINTPQDIFWVGDKLLVVYSGNGGGIAQFNADGSFDKQILNDGLGATPMLFTLGIVNGQIYAVGYNGNGVYRVDGPTTLTKVTPATGGGSLRLPNRIFVLAESFTWPALNPAPASGATEVDPEGTLTWTPGRFAATHDVYFGATFDDVNSASRTLPSGVLLSQGQDANSFDPPTPLEFGHTYYWRVDEVNALPDATIFKGGVWSFTVESLAYPVRNVVATSNGVSEEGVGPGKTVDGSGLDATAQHSTLNTDMWLSTPVDGKPLWIQYAFDGIYKLHQMWVWNHNVPFESILGFGLKDVTVEYSTDGATWTVLGNVQFAQATAKATYTHNMTVDLGGVAAKFVRLHVNSGWGAMGQYGLSEVRFLYIPAYARTPQPADEAVNVSVDTALDWRAGRGAALHQVYLSSDKQAVTDGTALVGQETTSRYEPASLDLGTTYYWKIDEVNEAAQPSTWHGDLWTFSTQEFRSVDDFESYTDEEGHRIFDTWIDGWVNNTGSTVGYLQAPFAERTVVHGGGQSMPLDYNNVKSPWYSEAERVFAAPQDWTVHGAYALTLYFRGNPVGFLQHTDGSIVMSGVGADIGGIADQLRFACKQLSGNGSIVAHVDSLTNIDPWTKVGVMIRHTLEPGSKFAAVYLTPGNGCRFQARATYSANATDDTAVATPAQIAIKAPYWIKLERSGDAFSASYSADGKTWTALAWNPQTVSMPGPIYMGLVVSSHSVGTAATAVFSGVATTGSVTGQWQTAAIGVGQPSNDPAPLYVALEDSAGHVKAVPHPDPEATIASTWQAWQIPLSQFGSAGVNLTKVNKMYIGVGDKKKPVAGGAGRVYVDDVRIDPLRPGGPATVLIGDASNRVLQYKVDGSTWTYQKVFAEGTYDGVALRVPMGICQDRQGRIYIGEEADGGRILRFDATGNFIDTVATDGKGGFVARCEAVVMGPDGHHVYTVDAFRGAGDQVYRVDIDTKEVSIFVPTKYDGVHLLNNPRGVAFGPNGNCFVSGRQNQAVYEFNGTTGAFVRTFADATHLDTPQDVLWVGDKLLVIYTGKGGGIAQFNSDGSFDKQILNEGLGATPMLFTLGSVNGKIYAVGYNGNGVYRVDGPTTVTKVTPATGDGSLRQPNRVFVLN